MSSIAVILLLVLLTIFVVSLLTLIRHGSRNPLENRLASKAGRSLVVVNALSVAGIVATMAYSALVEIRAELERGLSESISTVLNTTHEAVRIWSDDQLIRLNLIARDPDFAITVATIVEQYKNGVDLVQSVAVGQLRQQFKSMTVNDASVGFFVVSLSGRNIASMRDENIGLINPILEHRPDLFARVLNGESVMVHAIESDVPLPDHPLIQGSQKSPTMFFATPVRHRDGRIIAVLTERFNPYGRFSDILSLGRVGASGETYALNGQGYLVTESRFTPSMVATGLMTTDEGSILSVRVVEPVSVESELLRFTKMADSVLQKQSGINTEGYKDYRGVKVIGAWLWDDFLELGLTTEIDFSEAFLPYQKAQALILVIVGTALVFALICFAVVTRVSTRVNTQLTRLSAELEQRVYDRTEALRKSETRLQLVIDTVPAPIYLKDKNGVYELVNSALETAVRFSRADILGKTDAEMFDPQLATMIMKNDRDAMDGKVGVTIEEVVPLEEGQFQYFQSFKTPVVNSRGDVEGIVGASIDITQRKVMEESLKKTLNEMSFVKYAVDHAAQMILWADLASGQILYGNKQAISMLKLSDDDFLHKNIADLEFADESVLWPDMIAELKLGSKRYETLITDATGTKIPVEVISQIVSFGPDQRIVSFARDISEHKQMEMELVASALRAEEGSRAKSEFLASMSHEIRTPLNGVLGMISLVMRTPLEPEQTKRLKIAYQSATSLLGIINDLLDFSKMEAHKLEIEALDFNLPDFLQDVIDSVALAAEEKSITLSLNTDGLRHSNINSDPSRLRQVLLNLLSNAIKFTAQGSVSLTVTITQVDEKEYLNCVIEDTGIGISEKNISRLFKSFSQADASTTRKFGGTGLGLAISKKICQLMDGSIKVTSREGEGSRFSFSVEIKTTNVVIQKLPEVDISGMRALIVDDIDTNRLIFKSQLEAWKLVVDEVDSPLKTMEQLHKNFDVALIDLNMPEKNGIELAADIRANSAFDSLNILIMTSTTDTLSNQELKALNVSGYLAKPVNPKDLKDALVMIKAHGEDLRKKDILLTSQYLQTLSRHREDVSDNRLPINQQMKILLVEDNDINQLIVKGMLEAVGLGCDSVMNGQEALDYLNKRSAENPVDLVLMDCQMPILDGYQATEKIRAGEGGGWAKNLTIVALTAHALSGDKEKCLACGMNDFLTKPLNEVEFRSMLSRYSNVQPKRQAVKKNGVPAGDDKSRSALYWPDNLTSIDSASPPDFSKYKPAYCAALTVFVTQADSLPSQMEQALAEFNFTMLKERAHSLKGSSANLGFKTLSEACGELENSINLTGNCTQEQVSLVLHWLVQSRSDAQRILGANRDSTKEAGRQCIDIAKEIVALLVDNQVVSIELVNEFKQSDLSASLQSLAEAGVSQLMNFEYDEALVSLQQLIANA